MTGAVIHHRRASRRSGFTLIECMIAMFLIAMVLPAVELGFAGAQRSADLARRRTEAAGLAQSKLSELITTGNWQASAALQGDFGTDWKEYKWAATLTAWTGGNTQTSGTTTVTMEQLDVTVSWNAPNPPKSVTVSSLVYARSSSE